MNYKAKIAEMIAAASDGALESGKIQTLIEIPPEPKMGDFAEGAAGHCGGDQRTDHTERRYSGFFGHSGGGRLSQLFSGSWRLCA